MLNSTGRVSTTITHIILNYERILIVYEKNIFYVFILNYKFICFINACAQNHMWK